MQKLYEGPAGQEGLITYMRTDGTDLAPEAITALRGTAQRLFSPRHVPKDARVYRKKAKNAQEAHEAIRPTKPGLLPWTVPSSMGLSSDQLRVYDLIWRRALACQMAPAVLEQLSVDVEARGGAMELRGSGTRELFEGFRGAYRCVVRCQSDESGLARDEIAVRELLREVKWDLMCCRMLRDVKWDLMCCRMPRDVGMGHSPSATCHGTWRSGRG